MGILSKCPPGPRCDSDLVAPAGREPCPSALLCLLSLCSQPTAIWSCPRHLLLGSTLFLLLPSQQEEPSCAQPLNSLSSGVTQSRHLSSDSCRETTQLPQAFNFTNGSIWLIALLPLSPSACQPQPASSPQAPQTQCMPRTPAVDTGDQGCALHW